MGKTKHRSRRGKGEAPTGLPSVKETVQKIEELGESSETANQNGHASGSPKSVKATLESIIEKLQSKGVEEKECACCSLGMLCNRKDAIPELITSNVVKVAAPLLLDSSPTVSHSTVGALRAMSACSGYEVCENMVDQDVMTPLVALFKTKYPPCAWKPHTPVEGKLDSTKEIFVEAVQLLWNLCGNSSRAVHTFCRENLLAHLMPCLDLEVYGHDVVTAVAYCLYTVCEDNLKIATILNQKPNDEIMYSLLAIPGADSQCVLLRVLVAGIILNMNCNKLMGCSMALLATFVRVLSDALSVNVVPLLASALQKLRESEEASMAEESSLEKLISAQQVALEVVINLLCTDDDGDNWDNVSGSDNSETEHVTEVAMECEGTEQQQAPLSLDVEIHEALVSHNILAKVLAKVQFLDEELKVSLHKCEIGRRIYQNLITLQSRALFCLNNLAVSMDMQELGGAPELYKLWIGLGQFVFRQSGESRVELLEAATSAMSAILSKLVGEKSKPFEHFPMDDLVKLFEIVRRIDDARVKVNVIRIVGGLGCLMGVDPTSENSATSIKSIGAFLLEVGNSKNSELWVESEALDVLIDVFSEDETHPISVEIGLVDKLKSIHLSFKRKISSQRKTLGDHLPVAMTVRTNLARFIDYKTNYSSSSNGGVH